LPIPAPQCDLDQAIRETKDLLFAIHTEERLEDFPDNKIRFSQELVTFGPRPE
jgi:hypothetical protein